jgi:electron transport complex protein RnfD
MFLLVILAAMGPLSAGVVFFGWRALWVTALAIATCAATERMYYRLAHTPSRLGRSHACLTGLLLALTLPAHVPWYVPVVGGVVAIVVGKLLFGGVGHFVWQPALVGRLAVAVLFALQINSPAPLQPQAWPVLAQNKIITGDVHNATRDEHYKHWRGSSAPQNRDAFLLIPPGETLEGLTQGPPQYSALAYVPPPGGDNSTAALKPAVLMQLAPINDLLYGARPGGIGETCAVVIMVAGLYLVYRNYTKWQLPAAFILAACAVAALAPINLQGPNDTVISGWGPPGGWLAMNWLASWDQWSPPPLLREGLDVGFLYVCYQLLAGEFLLAAFFFVTEMTSRPVTTGGQVLFGIGGGATAMLLQMYVNVPVPAYMAVLLMNTFMPIFDSMWRPRVFGRSGWRWRRKSG